MRNRVSPVIAFPNRSLGTSLEEPVHEHYLSQKDLDFCLEYNITKLSGQANYAEIEKIFEELKNEYPQEETAST
ncbi:MAG: hypothetical protein K8F52_11980 [Candidatus Scalindua rubra]|nr:hypothetical protein [Candidatus Scalindua rubra]